MLKQGLQQRLLQKLSPQQIQLIKLLEIPTMELEQRIKEEMEVNPALEEGRAEEEDFYSNEDGNSDGENEKDPDKEEFTLDDYIQEEEVTPSYKLNANNYSKDDKPVNIPFSVGTSFNEFLYSQLGLRTLSEREDKLARYIIGNIDEDGYLRRDLESIVDDLAFQYIETNESELFKILQIIQDFDPPGVAARNLRECLLNQVERKQSENGQRDSLKMAQTILKKYFSEFSKKHYQKIMDRLNIAEEELKEAIDEIIKLNPKPGSSFGNQSVRSSVQAITPDFILEEIDGQFILSLNSSNMPELHVSRTYSTMLDDFNIKKKTKDKAKKDAVKFIKQKVDSAKWFIEAIKQRQETLLATMESILEYQRQFFITGDETKLRPMILKDIAEKTGLDISTISRVANSKFIQTPFGIYPLKHFFSEGMQTEDGEEVSTREIKQILRDCITKENKRKPLTDEKLAQILKDEKGYKIARRTVAKYREQLEIPVARMRKEL